MDRNSIIAISRNVYEKTGIWFRPDLRKPENFFEIHLTPEAADISEVFSIVVKIGWKKIFCSFIPGDKAGLLVFEMGKAPIIDKKIFSSVAENIIEKRGNVLLSINGQIHDPTDYNTWPEIWTSINLSISSPFIETEFDLVAEDQLDYLIIHWVEKFISMILPLLPIKTVEKEKLDENEGTFEGKQYSRVSTIYERNRKNRQACLAAHGYKCKVCKFDFEQTYGVLGKNFIEVHHIVPLHTLGKNYLINPVKDMVPLCSNCHAMIHRSEPPLTIEQLKEIVKMNQ